VLGNGKGGQSRSEWRGGSEKLAGGMGDTSFQLASSQLHVIYYATGCRGCLDGRVITSSLFMRDLNKICENTLISRQDARAKGQKARTNRSFASI